MLALLLCPVCLIICTMLCPPTSCDGDCIIPACWAYRRCIRQCTRCRADVGHQGSIHQGSAAEGKHRSCCVLNFGDHSYFETSLALHILSSLFVCSSDALLCLFPLHMQTQLQNILAKMETDRQWIDNVHSVVRHYQAKVASVKLGLRQAAQGALAIKHSILRKNQFNRQQVGDVDHSVVEHAYAGLLTRQGVQMIRSLCGHELIISLYDI